MTPSRPLRFGLEVAQMGGGYPEMRAAWLEADRLVAAGATHLIFSCPVPYSAAGARAIWNDVVRPLRG